MREIKFRALKDDMSNCCFVYGYLVITPGGTPRIMNDVGGLFTTCLKGTEGQFTGLLDKTGKEIYEGDILKTLNHYEGKKPVYNFHAVCWRDRLSGWFCLNRNDKTEKENDGSLQLWVYAKNCEFSIAGNIYETPKQI